MNPMITSKPSSKQDWQQELIQAVTDPRELYQLLELDPASLNIPEKALGHFPLKVPRGFVARMQKGNPLDPLLRQVLPLSAEDQLRRGYLLDPLNEESANPLPGLLHKYRGRVLFTLTGGCAINCRYCFRRHFAYAENNPSQQGWEKAFAYIQNDPTIEEVILSGGDPLLLNDRSLQTFTDQLARLVQIKRLRIHSRIPIVLPERITSAFLAWIASLQQAPVLVTHCNHPQEINDEVKAVMRLLKQAGVTLLNQAVLLKGINDHLEIQIALSEALFAAGIQPYYLHLFDKVQGAAHFDLPFARAKKLYQELSLHLPGYLLPKLAKERPGKGAKSVFAT